jgi:hypothetical protein
MQVYILFHLVNVLYVQYILFSLIIPCQFDNINMKGQLVLSDSDARVTVHSVCTVCISENLIYKGGKESGLFDFSLANSTNIAKMSEKLTVERKR